MDTTQHPPEAPRPTVARPPPTVTSSALLAGGRELIIEHGDDKYRLRVTSKGKLILVK